jgi:hypothetical protein
VCDLSIPSIKVACYPTPFSVLAASKADCFMAKPFRLFDVKVLAEEALRSK